ncbi:unannotated protein [freshwater metagenome]|uniref:Unannotated protein n=1 Tax=freshwater metagenome TaxID=449393 RepID=A0A6J6FQN8_9ZZZZ
MGIVSARPTMTRAVNAPLTGASGWRNSAGSMTLAP